MSGIVATTTVCRKYRSLQNRGATHTPRRYEVREHYKCHEITLSIAQQYCSSQKPPSRLCGRKGTCSTVSRAFGVVVCLEYNNAHTSVTQCMLREERAGRYCCPRHRGEKTALSIALASQLYWVYVFDESRSPPRGAGRVPVVPHLQLRVSPRAVALFYNAMSAGLNSFMD